MKRSFPSRGSLLPAAVMIFGTVLPGVAWRLLGEAGYNGLGMVVLTLGCAGMAAIVWYGWTRPLDTIDPVE